MATPFAGVQVFSVYRHKVGAFEITVLSDGNIALEATLFSGDQARAEKLLEAAFLPKVVIPTAVNEWLINTGEKLILVDTGASNVFLPTLGRLPQNLAAAGVDLSAVDDIVITHMHPDHVPGLLAADGTMMFKNAIIHINGDEYAFWTSDQIREKAPEAVRPFFDLAKAAIKPYADAGKVQNARQPIEFSTSRRFQTCRQTNSMFLDSIHSNKKPIRCQFTKMSHSCRTALWCLRMWPLTNWRLLKTERSSRTTTTFLRTAPLTENVSQRRRSHPRIPHRPMSAWGVEMVKKARILRCFC